jgi:hypothetical protein
MDNITYDIIKFKNHRNNKHNNHSPNHLHSHQNHNQHQHQHHNSNSGHSSLSPSPQKAHRNRRSSQHDPRNDFDLNKVLSAKKDQTEYKYEMRLFKSIEHTSHNIDLVVHTYLNEVSFFVFDFPYLKKTKLI